MIIGVGSRNVDEFEEIWTVVRSENLFFIFIFKMGVEATFSRNS